MLWVESNIYVSIALIVKGLTIFFANSFCLALLWMSDYFDKKPWLSNLFFDSFGIINYVGDIKDLLFRAFLNAPKYNPILSHLFRNLGVFSKFLRAKDIKLFINPSFYGFRLIVAGKYLDISLTALREFFHFK